MSNQSILTPPGTGTSTQIGAAVEPVRQYTRIPALDFTKGALVLTMVLYHWWNYFISPQGDVYRYLRFLTPSFIFISGFLVSHVYLRGYGAANPRVPRRLLERGLKILAVFVALNAARLYVIPDVRAGMMPKVALDLDALVAVFVSGNVAVAGSKIAAFPILVPIAYLLMLSAGLMVLCRYFRSTIYVACAFFLACIPVLGYWDIASGNLAYIAVGLLGMVLGMRPIETISGFVRHAIAVGAGYAGYLLIVTFWNNYLTQLLGVAANVMMMFMLGWRGTTGSRIYRHILLLGNYSLFGYIAQIAILQILRRLLPSGPSVTVLVLSFGLAFALTMISVEVLARLRRKTMVVDRLYKAVFA